MRLRTQCRDDYTEEDVEHYFNYAGCLAVEGTYDRMEQMMRTGGNLLLLPCIASEGRYGYHTRAAGQGSQRGYGFL